MDKDTIEKALGAFSLGQIQDFVTMHGIMREHDISVAHLEEYVKTEQARLAGQIKADCKHLEKMPDCPACGEKLSIRAIRLPKGPSNRKGWKSLWQCLAEDCVYEAYSTRTVAEELEQL